MKYNIEGFSQEKLVSMGLDTKDAILLRDIMDYNATGRMRTKIINGKEMFWVDYSNLIKQLPILGLKNKDAMYRRLHKLVDAGLLEHETVRMKGTYSFYRFSDKLYSLSYLSDEKQSNSDSLDDFLSDPLSDEKSDQKTILTKDYSIKEELKEKSTSKKKQPHDSVLAEMTDHRRESFELWLKHKSEKAQSYKKTGFALLVKKWACETDAALREAVESSAANGYSGLYSPRNGTATKQENITNTKEEDYFR